MKICILCDNEIIASVYKTVYKTNGEQIPVHFWCWRCVIVAKKEDLIDHEPTKQETMA